LKRSAGGSSLDIPSAIFSRGNELVRKYYGDKNVAGKCSSPGKDMKR
jgi:hypothetical protein